jgi:hypothetical protein
MSQGNDSAAGADDWRLEAELHVAHPPGTLGEVVGRFRGPDPVQDAKRSVPEDVVITHDSRKLFAYAASQEQLMAARRAIEQALRDDGIGATVRVSRWDEKIDRWHQVDPPLVGEQERAQERAEQEAGAVQTRTFVAHAGRVARKDFEQTMLGGARELGLECTIVEHPHLLTTQVAFTVTGPRHKIEEFAAALKSEGRAMMRADTEVIISPL